MKLWRALRGGVPEERALSMDDYISLLQKSQGQFPVGWMNRGVSGNGEEFDQDFQSYIYQAYRSNGIVFACMLTRQLIFSEARFQYQRMRGGRATDLWGDDSLSLLENPWPNGTTGELLSRAIQDVDLSGNHYLVREGDRVRRLRPDWVKIILTQPPDEAVKSDVAGYIYMPGGHEDRKKWEFYPIEDSTFAHWTPIPDPDAMYKGMSWITPVLRDVFADVAATRHKAKFFDHAATPQLAISFKETVTNEQFKEFMEVMDSTKGGVDHAYENLYLGGGADVTVVGADLKQLDFKTTQGAGEPLALDTPIPTPSGWTTMGEICPGDKVIGRNGKPANVVGVSPVHEGRVCYRVTLKDRTSIVADASHLWAATDQQNRKEATYTTEELYYMSLAGYSDGASGHRVSLPLSPVVELPEQDLLIDPYVLGAWLGDGATAGAAICGATEDLKYIAGQIESRGYTTTAWNTADDKVDVIGIPGGLLVALRAEGVLGDKRIPDLYLRGSVLQRLDLLRGLMDTDGSVESRAGKRYSGRCEFSSKWEYLARQVVELIRSLGYRVTLSEKKDERSRTGSTWRVSFRVEQDRIPFLLPRKVDLCIKAGDPKVNCRSVVSIELMESVPVRCIAVDTEDHLFLAGEGFVPTHNTRISMAARIPPVILGGSEGLGGSSLNAGNYQSAKKQFGDGMLRPYWRSICAAYTPLVNPPKDSRLWYDDRDIEYLRQDRKDVAEIQARQARTFNILIMAGCKPESIVKFIQEEDWNALEHTGLYSVQLQPPGTVGKGVVPPGQEPSGGDSAPQAPPNGKPVKAIAPPNGKPTPAAMPKKRPPTKTRSTEKE